MDDETSQASAKTKKTKRDAARGARQPSRWAQWWRFFWMRRSGARTIWALILAIPALLAAIYLALPERDQTLTAMTIQAAWRAAGQFLGPTGWRVVAEVALLLFALASLTLLLAPGYRQYRYLHLPTSVIPRSTLLLDFENMASNADGERLLELMLEHLKATLLSSQDFSQRRVDLLYFMNARHLTPEKISENQEKGKRAEWIATNRRLNKGYNELYLNGFQLVNSPHKVIPSQDPMKEAVDRAIELFAFERALLGGFKQEFVIVSGDGDYAPLIYRLVALGHGVQIWMWGATGVYDELKKRIPLTVVHLLPPEQDPTAQESARAQRDSGTTGISGATTSGSSVARALPPVLPSVAPLPQEPPHVEFSQPGMQALYGIIYATVAKYRSLAAQLANERALFNTLSTYLDGSVHLSQQLQAVGYAGKGSRGAWIRSISAVGAFGAATPDQAARQFFSLALVAAHALAQTPANREGLVPITNVLATLDTIETASADPQAALAMLANTRYGAIDVRYLALCARALSIIAFTSAPTAPDLISGPRLTELGERLSAQLTTGQPDAPEASA